ncbi:unannotated protein [freshwater metagenome]|uniref:Unannotated protein n=1 Tax=freshwater metagenome TaxID=449393 RepID=A0A6J7HWT3_9ZZZZ
MVKYECNHRGYEECVARLGAFHLRKPQTCVKLGENDLLGTTRKGRQEVRTASVNDGCCVQHDVTRTNVRHEVDEEVRDLRVFTTHGETDALRQASCAACVSKSVGRLWIARYVARRMRPAPRDRLNPVVSLDDLYGLAISGRLAVVNDGATLRVVDLVDVLLPGVLFVKGHPHETSLSKCVVDDNAFDAVGQHDPHSIAGVDPPLEERVTDAIGCLIEFAERNEPAIAFEGGCVAKALGGIAD